MPVYFHNGVVLFDAGAVAFDQDCCCVPSDCCPTPPENMHFQMPTPSQLSNRGTGDGPTCDGGTDGCTDFQGEYSLPLIALGQVNTPCAAINGFMNSGTIPAGHVPVHHWLLEFSAYCTVHVNELGFPFPAGTTIGCDDAKDDEITFVMQVVNHVDFITGECFLSSQFAWYNTQGASSLLQICRNYNYSGVTGSGPIDVAAGQDCADPVFSGLYGMVFDVDNSSETNPGYPDVVDQEHCWVCLMAQDNIEPILLHFMQTRGAF